jgi:hypothetical protein
MDALADDIAPLTLKDTRAPTPPSPCEDPCPLANSYGTRVRGRAGPLTVGDRSGVIQTTVKYLFRHS